MIVERKNDEIVVRLSSQTNLSDLQDMINYLEYKELVSKSKAKQSEIDKLVNEINRSMTEKVRKSRS